MTASSIEVGLSRLCPVCGASVGQYRQSMFQCRHCGFFLEPRRGPTPSVESVAGDVLRQARALGLWGIGAHILVLVPGDDLRAAIAVLPVFSGGNITFVSDTRPLPGGRFDLVLAGGAVERAGDVNRMMAAISAMLAARGQMTLDPAGRRFGGNSLQILLERHGFRLGRRPLKWRILNCFRRRFLARKL